MSEPIVPMAKAFRDMLIEAREKLEAASPPPEIIVSPEVELKVRQFRAWMPTTCCAITAATGENHCDHSAPPRPSWHRRLRWRLQSKWSALRMRLGSWVAGVDLDEWDDD